MTTNTITIDMDFATLEEALTIAEAFTEADCEVTKPLQVAGRYCIRAETTSPAVANFANAVKKIF